MPVRRKPSIARAFSSAEDYDTHAVIQRAAAKRLAEIISALPLPPRSTALEIGCGTGFLSEELARSRPECRLILSDLSEAMVRRTRAVLDNPFLVMDGEHPALCAGSMNLICSSLAFQWFENLEGTITRLTDLLSPGGHLAFATLTAGTFAEWRAAHSLIGLAPATRDYPSPAEIAALCPAELQVNVEAQTLIEQHLDGISFLRSLKAIGADTPWEPRTPLSPGSLRGVLRAFEEMGASATYQIAHVIISKLPEGL